MKTKMKTTTRFVLAAFTAAALLPALATAQEYKNQGYLGDTQESIVMSGTGLCWHTSDWTPGSSAERCDPARKPVAAAQPVPAPLAPPAPIVAAVRAPAPVIAAAPVVAQPLPVAPTPRKISFSADALFAFDKSELRPEGRAMLDDLVSQLNGASYESIQAMGHADRFGSAAYNQRLSERRATAVKDYLIEKNVLASRIDAAGKGETQPVTRAGDCTGAKSAKVIACLQPDRRVDVEMTGTTTVTSSR